MTAKLFFVSILILATSLTAFSQTDDWKLYSSTAQGFAVKYPSDWRASEDSYKQVRFASFISPGVFDYDVTYSAGIGICSQPKGHASNSSDSRSKCRQRDDHLSDIAKDKVVSDETIEINGVKIRKKITENKYRPDATYIYAFFSTEDRDVLMMGNFPRRFDLDRYIPVFDEMLSNLSLIGKDDSLTYRNEKYRFSVTFPASWRSCPIDHRSMEQFRLLMLAPEGRNCLGANSVTISLQFMSNKQNELPNIQLNFKEKTEGNYVYRDKFFTTGYGLNRVTLKISEMTNKTDSFAPQANEIVQSIQSY